MGLALKRRPEDWGKPARRGERKGWKDRVQWRPCQNGTHLGDVQRPVWPRSCVGLFYTGHKPELPWCGGVSLRDSMTNRHMGNDNLFSERRGKLAIRDFLWCVFTHRHFPIPSAEDRARFSPPSARQEQREMNAVIIISINNLITCLTSLLDRLFNHQ